MEENYTYEHPLLDENTLENTFASIESTFIPQICAIVKDVIESQKSIDEIYTQISSLLEIFCFSTTVVELFLRSFLMG